jgi:hypothetical protein
VGYTWIYSNEEETHNSMGLSENGAAPIFGWENGDKPWDFGTKISSHMGSTS